MPAKPNQSQGQTESDFDDFGYFLLAGWLTIFRPTISDPRVKSTTLASGFLADVEIKTMANESIRC